MLGPGADTGAPNPGNEVVAPPNRGLGGVTPTSSLFSDNCTADEGVRLNGSELAEDGCGGAGALGPKLNEAKGGPRVSKLGVCAKAVGARESEGSGIAAPVSDLLVAIGSSTP